jgi:predicted alpha/beta-hydrolase family hydrolase
MPASIRDFADNAADPNVRGFLHVPETPNGNALILTHGAGSNAQAPLLIALAETFSAAGFTVLRCDLPYRQSRSFGPPGPGDAARDRAGLKNAIASLANELGAPRLAASARRGDLGPSQPASKKIFLAGHSYGGRQSSMLCAELSEKEPDLVAGLLLLSYPLHPPRKPEQQRTQHLPNLHTRTLFVHGTRDPFGSIAELEHAIKMIPAQTKLLPVEGAGHDLGFKGKTKQGELPRLILSEFTKFFALSS